MSAAALSPGGFFGGIAIGFLACVLAGRAVSQRNVLGDRPRIHDYLGPITAFYPTASEVIAMVAARSSPERITVIVGGNSVFHGDGQPVGEVWTRRLQDLLGDGYRVSNLALKGAGPLGAAGSMAAEALTKRGGRVIFVTNTFPGDSVAPFGSPPFDYISWDALEKGLLMDFSERTQFLRESGRTKPSQRNEEMRLRMRLDGVCYFNDLWTATAYHVANTVWERNTNQRFFLPRKRFPDVQVARRSGEPMTPARFEDGLLSIRRVAASESFGIDGARFALPAALKRRSLVVVSGRSPEFAGHQSESERTASRRAYARARDEWEQAGYRAFDSSEGVVGADDFWDGVHLTSAGGEKIAEAIAPLIREIAGREFPPTP